MALCVLSHFSGVHFFVWSHGLSPRQAPLPMGILQTRILEQIAMLSSWGSSQPRDPISVPRTAGRFFPLSSPVGFFHLLLYVCIRRPCSSAFSLGLSWLRKLGWPSQPLLSQIFFFLLKLEQKFFPVFSVWWWSCVVQMTLCTGKHFLNCKLATWCQEPKHWKRPWFWERLKTKGEGGGRGAWCAAVHGVAKSGTRLSDWTTTKKMPCLLRECF